jgi:alpha-beta hydrolase superfamily lysophospholipase
MDDAVVDVLGEPYLSETIEFPPDSEGAVVATLVSRRAGARTGHAVLYLHGFCDYFFQTNLADFYVERGYDFYALDLRKYGRSLRDHHTPNFCTDLADYFPELDEALRLIRERDGHSLVVVNGHSTGALIGAIWADARRARGTPVAEGFVMNSPWLDLAGSLAMRTVGTAAIKRLGRMQPYRIIPRSVTSLYVEGMHRDFRGEWEFDLAWKPASSFPVRAGWIAAVRRAHAALHAGIDVGAPVLVLRSARSSVPREWDDRIQSTDTVLDVRHMARWANCLGRNVTTCSIDGAMHDVTASREPARGEAFDQIDRWLRAYVESPFAARQVPDGSL